MIMLRLMMTAAVGDARLHQLEQFVTAGRIVDFVDE
jgi:hypothetical protein